MFKSLVVLSVFCILCRIAKKNKPFLYNFFWNTKQLAMVYVDNVPTNMMSGKDIIVPLGKQVRYQGKSTHLLSRRVISRIVTTDKVPTDPIRQVLIVPNQVPSGTYGTFETVPGRTKPKQFI